MDRLGCRLAFSPDRTIRVLALGFGFGISSFKVWVVSQASSKRFSLGASSGSNMASKGIAPSY